MGLQNYWHVFTGYTKVWVKWYSDRHNVEWSGLHESKGHFYHWLKYLSFGTIEKNFDLKKLTLDSFDRCGSFIAGQRKHRYGKKTWRFPERCQPTTRVLYWGSLARQSSFRRLFTSECFIVLETSTWQTLSKSSIFWSLARHERTIKL